MLKAAILETSPVSRQDAILNQFRGQRAHDFEWLLREYRRRGGTPLPVEFREHFVRVESWSTRLRYSPGMIEKQEAQAFFRSVETILEFLEGRI